MKHDILVINGLSRGGSNILWNILQSHQKVVSPIHETGEVFYPGGTRSLITEQIRRFGH